MSRARSTSGPGAGNDGATLYDKNATIRSNRSHRSARAVHLAVHDTRTFRAPTAAVTRSQPPLPPPPYQASQSPTPDDAARRDLSPSTMSLTSSRWDERTPRWSVWTADTTLSDDDDGEYVGSASKDVNHDTQRIRRPARHDEYDGEEAGPSSYSPPRSGASTPPSPTSEAALDAALSSTMLALTTANSLLLSTMASRRELARLRALEAALEGDFTRKEAELRRKIDSNNRMIGWMEHASKRLDDVMEGRETDEGWSPSMSAAELDELTSGVGGRQRPPTSSVPFKVLARHDRIASVSTVDARDHAAPNGVLEAKDETSTVGKSAAKRLERMLQRSQLSVSEAAAPAVSTSSSSKEYARSASSLPSPVAAGEVSGVPASQTSPSRPSASRHTRGNALQLRLATSKFAAPLTASSDVTFGSPVSEQSLRRLNATSVSSSTRRSVSGLSDTGLSTAPSSQMDDGSKDDGPASRMLTSIINGRSQVVSTKGEDATFDKAHSQRETNASSSTIRPTSLVAVAPRPTALAAAPASYFLTTPPMPAVRQLSEQAAADQEAAAVAAAGTPGASLRHRPSLSNVRSPNALQAVGNRGSYGPSSNNEAHGVAAVNTTQRKGALEALRRLNSNSTTATVGGSTSGGDSSGGSAIVGGGGGGWGGTLASWMGISGAGNGEHVGEHQASS